MSGTTFAFTYADRAGAEDAIALESMRKLWVEPARSGIVFAEPAADGTEVLHEVVTEGAEVADGMAAVMHTLLIAPSFERVESPPADRRPLLLEFRYPEPQVVALALRAS